MNLLREILTPIKKLCNNDEVCLMIVFVLIGVSLCWLFKDRISGYANFAEFSGDSSQGPSQGPSQGTVKNDTPIGIELKPRKPLPTPSTNRQLEVMASKPPVENQPINQKTGIMTQDSMIFKPFDEIWNPGFMPLDMVFQNIQDGVKGSMIPKSGMGPDRPMAPMAPMAPNGIPSQGVGGGGANGSVNLVLLYAPWCGHSKKMLPDYERIKSEFDGKVVNGKQVTITMYDSDVDKDKVKEYGVKGFPTLFIEKDGQKEPFPHRSYDKIAGYLNNL